MMPHIYGGKEHQKEEAFRQSGPNKKKDAKFYCSVKIFFLEVSSKLGEPKKKISQNPIPSAMKHAIAFLQLLCKSWNINPAQPQFLTMARTHGGLFVKSIVFSGKRREMMGCRNEKVYDGRLLNFKNSSTRNLADIFFVLVDLSSLSVYHTYM